MHTTFIESHYKESCVYTFSGCLNTFEIENDDVGERRGLDEYARGAPPPGIIWDVMHYVEILTM